MDNSIRESGKRILLLRPSTDLNPPKTVKLLIVIALLIGTPLSLFAQSPDSDPPPSPLALPLYESEAFTERVLQAYADPEAAREEAAAFYQNANAVGDNLGMAQAKYIAAITYAGAEDTVNMRAELVSGRSLINEADHTLLYVDTVQAIGASYGNEGRLIEAVEHFSNALEISERYNHKPAILRSQYLMGELFITVYDYESAVEYLEPVVNDLELAEHTRPWATFSLAKAYLRTNRIEEALPLYEEAVATAPHIYARSVYLADYARILIEINRLDDAEASSQEALALAERLGNRGRICEARFLLAITALERNDPDETLRFIGSNECEFDKFADMIRPIVKVDWLPTIIRARLALGQTEAALGDFEQLLEAQETNFARNRANSLGIAEAQMRLSQRDGRIDFLEQEQELNRARLQTRTLIAVVAILSTVLLLGLSVFISRSYRNQTRVNAVLEESVSRNRERAQTAEQSLEHKSILINEIHHRVKNNFQTIISLLNTQRRQLGPSATEAAADILNDVSARVKTMAIVQQSLNSIEETDALNAHAFIDTLVVQLIEASGRPIRTNTDVDDVILQSEIAAPLALIIHELVSNTLKHAFAGPSGSLEIKLKENSGDELELTCADNGRGFPEGASIEAISSFGLTIIRDLTKQISGSVTFKNANPGMTCRITFPGRQAAVTS